MGRTRSLTGLALTFGLAVALVFGSGSAVAAGPSSDRLEAALDRVVAEPGAPPGVSVLIQRGAKREFHSRGLADIARGRRPAPRLPMRIASVSKAFSGAVALALVARGRLSLDDTIGKWLPGLMPRARKVTLRQALNHTAGLPDYIRDPAFLRIFLRDPSRGMTPRRLLSFVRNKPLRHRPGTKYEYSDTDNIVVALMAEAAAGKRYERLLRELVFRPLKLRRTSLPRTLAMPAPFLHGYDVPDPTAPEPGPPDPTSGDGAAGAPQDVSRLINPTLAWASGGMVSTPVDLGRFFRAYVSGRLFRRPAGQRRRASRPLRGIVPQRAFVPGGASSPPGPGRNAAGLGLFRYRTPCGTVFGHTGSFPGYRMFAAASRDGRRSVVFAVNAQIVPGQGSERVSNLIRHAQTLAVCRALR